MPPDHVPDQLTDGASERVSDRLHAWVEIDLGALVRNARRIAARAGVPVLPMIKADAYGLGAVRVARALEIVHPWGYGVATVEEGAELRRAGITRPILLATPLLPVGIEAAHAARLTPGLGDPDVIEAWVAATGNAPWHLAIDTGMSRNGIRWDAVGEIGPLLRRAPPAGAYTHFLAAEADDASVASQTARFTAAVGALPARPPILHAENSAAVERLSGTSSWSLVRPGIVLYGVGTRERDIADGPEPVVALHARVVEVRTIRAGETVSYGGSFRAAGPMRIATVAAGYADGYRRAFSNVGQAIIQGRRTRVVGIVTMDMTMLDVSDVACAVGDVVTLLGTPPAEGRAAGRGVAAGIDIRAAARAAGLLPYEVLTGLRHRLRRVYLDPPPG